MSFRDRADAGRRLAQVLGADGWHDPIVLGIPRGGVVVAAAVATALSAALDVFVARKIGAPGQPEFGIGAVGEGGVVVASDAVHDLGLSGRPFADLADHVHADVELQATQFRRGRPLPPLAGRDVILVDDGLATGVTAEAALRALRAMAPRRLVLAVPVAAAETVRRLRRLADAVVCVDERSDLRAVGDLYLEFTQTTGEQVLALLAGTT